MDIVRHMTLIVTLRWRKWTSEVETVSNIETEDKYQWEQSSMKSEIFIIMNIVIAEIILELKYLNPNSYDFWC